MFFKDSVLICNGEIYNYKELIKKYNLNCVSRSDCEVIIQLYEKLKSSDISSHEEIVKKLCQELDGEFAFIIYDADKIIVARDRYGVRPLFYGKNNTGSDHRSAFGFASELKNLDVLFDDVTQFTPSTFLIIADVTCDIDITQASCKYYDIVDTVAPHYINDEEDAILKIREALEKSVEKRLSCDVPICALLSGGLDSSLVCGIITKKLGKGILNTFSIGMVGSTDLYNAKKVADHIGSIHHEVIVTEYEMLNAIYDVIKSIESYDITTVRASIPNYLIAKYIKENTNFKCVFSGEMSDEMMGGYLYFKKSLNETEFDNECNRLLTNICYFDNLRADKCISSQELEARVPFSDHYLAKIVQSINPCLRKCDNRIEKYLLRKAFEKSDIIPEEILWREKEAFSDAVSSKENSWYKILQEHIDSLVTDEEYNESKSKYLHCTPMTKESYYYRKVFSSLYNNQKIIPYFWLPKKEWCGEMTDPSARELS